MFTIVMIVQKKSVMNASQFSIKIMIKII